MHPYKKLIYASVQPLETFDFQWAPSGEFCEIDPDELDEYTPQWVGTDESCETV